MLAGLTFAVVQQYAICNYPTCMLRLPFNEARYTVLTKQRRLVACT